MGVDCEMARASKGQRVHLCGSPRPASSHMMRPAHVMRPAQKANHFVDFACFLVSASTRVVTCNQNNMYAYRVTEYHDWFG